MLEVPPTMFGPWRFDRDNLTLWLPAESYEVDVEACLEPADVVEWLSHVRGKTWAAASVVGFLVEGLMALLYGHDNPGSVSPQRAATVILENERVVLTDRLVEEHMQGIEDPLGAITAGDLLRLEGQCRAEVDAQFDTANAAEIKENLLPSGLSVDDVYAIGLANGECPVGRVGRGYGADELVMYLFDWLTGTFGEPRRIDANDVREVRHAVLLTDQQKEQQGYGDENVFDMDPLAEFQNGWTARGGTST